MEKKGKQFHKYNENDYKRRRKAKNRVDRIKLHNVETQKFVLNDTKYERKNWRNKKRNEEKNQQIITFYEQRKQKACNIDLNTNQSFAII